MTATRRAAMFGIAAATASPAFAGPVPAPSAIEAALSEYKRLEAVLIAAREREDAACRAYDPPPRPRWEPSEGGAHYFSIGADGVRRAYLEMSKEVIADLREFIAKPDPLGLFGNKNDARRRLSRIEAFLEARDRAEAACGIPEAEAASNAAVRALIDHGSAMLALDPATLRDAIILARIARDLSLEGLDVEGYFIDALADMDMGG